MADAIWPMPNKSNARHSVFPIGPYLRLADTIRSPDCSLPIVSPILSTGHLVELLGSMTTLSGPVFVSRTGDEG